MGAQKTPWGRGVYLGEWSFFFFFFFLDPVLLVRFSHFVVGSRNSFILLLRSMSFIHSTVSRYLGSLLVLPIRNDNSMSYLTQLAHIASVYIPKEWNCWVLDCAMFMGRSQSPVSRETQTVNAWIGIEKISSRCLNFDPKNLQYQEKDKTVKPNASPLGRTTQVHKAVAD